MMAFSVQNKRGKIFYAKHGTPTEDRFRPTEKHFDQLQKQLKTLEEMDYPVVMICESGSFWEYFFEGTGIGAAGYAMPKNSEHVRKVMDDAFKMTEFAWKMMLDAGAEWSELPMIWDRKDADCSQPHNGTNLFDRVLAN